MSERQIDIEVKLLALLELSKSTAKGTENEAKLALEMAIRLASKHGISLTKLAEKRQAYAGDWFKGSTGETKVTEFTEQRFAEYALRRWSDLAEQFGWKRHRRMMDDREGLILMYRKLNQVPKLEVRIFERPWHDVEFEVLRNPDPILGEFESWMNHIFDIEHLGVTYHDFEEWLKAEAAGIKL
jgi:hypothetical protein